MSSVRMCDYPGCGTVFSESVEGWQTATLNEVEYDDNGSPRQITVRQDLCPDHAVANPHRKNKTTEYDRRIAALEAENKRLDKLTESINQVGNGT